MNRELLDQHVPTWETLSHREFRVAVNECDALMRPALRAAHAELVPPPPPVLEEGVAVELPLEPASPAPPADPPPPVRKRRPAPE